MTGTIQDIRLLRSQFLATLFNWKKQDRFFGSIESATKTSFTCTGYVLAAYHDSREYFRAQELGDDLAAFLKKDPFQIKIFPNETEVPGHVECNCKPALALLKSQPLSIHNASVKDILDWLLQSQNRDGSWDLYPGDGEKVSNGRVLWTLKGKPPLG